MAQITINRAGKVRKQTPQCPKKDSARRKTGRAAIRKKFTKRMEIGYFEANGKIKMNVNVSSRN
jgi:small subunit ribosomal protein S30e